MFRFIFKKALPLPKIESFETYLFVAPHPDDIEVACGGTVAKLAQMGKKITFLIVTNGCVGSVDKSLTTDQLVEIRREEALQSAKLLGVSDVRFLPFDDGAGYKTEDVLREVVQTILEVKPQIVFCPDHTVPSECHPDHLAVGNIVTQAIFVVEWEKLTQRLGLHGCCDNVAVAYYYTHKPNRFVGVRKTHKLHMQAIACHKSQFTPQNLQALQKYFTIREIRFGLRCGKGRAEGFRVLTLTHRHCFPEASEF